MKVCVFGSESAPLHLCPLAAYTGDVLGIGAGSDRLHSSDKRASPPAGFFLPRLPTGKNLTRMAPPAAVSPAGINHVTRQARSLNPGAPVLRRLTLAAGLSRAITRVGVRAVVIARVQCGVGRQARCSGKRERACPFQLQRIKFPPYLSPPLRNPRLKLPV